MASFSLAVNESFKTRDGEKNDRVEWFRCVCWNKLAEISGQYVTTGKLLFVEGRLQTRKYDDRQGNARKVVEVVVTQLRLLGGNRGGNGNGNNRTEGSGRLSSANGQRPGTGQFVERQHPVLRGDGAGAVALQYGLAWPDALPPPATCRAEGGRRVTRVPIISVPISHPRRG